MDLMTRPHPTFDPSDFTVVEHVETSDLVSALCLIDQTWRYGSGNAQVEFDVGRVELVATHPDWRRKGFIRAQMDVIHGWSAERGQWVQAITGIPWYYRQFGYEMTMTLGGGRTGYKSNVPKLKNGEQEPYRVRPVKESDLAFVAQVYDHGGRRWPVACVLDEALWRYELDGRSPQNDCARALRLIESQNGEPVGFFIHSHNLWKGRIYSGVYELKAGASWLEITPPVVRYLWATGEAYARSDPKQEMVSYGFWLGANHPVYQAFESGLPHTRTPYAWYLRVPDLPGFIRHITPVLEDRLAGSIAAGHSGNLHISFYRNGLKLVFESGRLAAVEPWQPTDDKQGDAAFPDLTFLQLLFQYRSLAELKGSIVDCWTSGDTARVLLDVLFPKHPSDVWPVS
jgi:hypothetical protein